MKSISKLMMIGVSVIGAKVFALPIGIETDFNKDRQSYELKLTNEGDRALFCPEIRVTTIFEDTSVYRPIKVKSFNLYDVFLNESFLEQDQVYENYQRDTIEELKEDYRKPFISSSRLESLSQCRVANIHDYCNMLGRKDVEDYTLTKIMDGFNNPSCDYLEHFRPSRLNLSNRNIEMFRPISFLDSIKYLDLSSNPIGELKNIKNLARLVKLDISDTRIDSLSDITKNIKLKHLNVANTDITNIDDIRYFRDLRSLDISGLTLDRVDEILELQNLRCVRAKNSFVRSMTRKQKNQLARLQIQCR